MSSSVPPILPEPKPQKEGESKEKEFSEGASFLRQVNTFLSWIAELITKQAKASVKSKSKESIKDTHDIALKQQSEVIKNAAKVIARLEETKFRLTEQFGSSARGFIAKSIDPMIAHAHQLICDLADGKTDEKGTILDQAVKAVELYQGFSNEERLIEKIIEESQALTLQAIEKDIDMLFRYQIQALDENMGISEGLIANELEMHLLPIFHELKALCEIKKEITDLHEFFLWKSFIDDKRDALVNLGFFTIDTIISKVAPDFAQRSFDQEFDDEDDTHSIPKIKQLSSIEERVLSLHEDLETRTLSLNEATIQEIENVLSDLKSYIDDFYENEKEDSKVRKNLEITRSHIDHAQKMLKSKQKTK